MYRKLWMSGFFFLVVGAAPALAQFGQMRGTVKGEDGKPLADAVISIDREDVKGHYEVKTDKNGSFFHAGLPLGRYSVAVMRDGEKFFSLSGFQTRASEPALVEIDLQQERLRAEAAAAGVQVQTDPGGKMTPEQIAALEKASQERAEAIKKRQDLMNHYNQGMEAMKVKDYDGAITAFEAAMTTDPNQDVLYAQLGEAYRNKSLDAKDATQRKEWQEKSLQSYQKSLELKPTDASYHNNFALALAASGKMDEAHASLRKAAELDPPNGGRYYFNLGAMLVNVGNVKDAAEAFRKATEMTPDYADAYFQLGVTLTGMAAVDKDGKIVPVPGTAEALQKYLQLAPNGPNAASAKDLLSSLGSAVDTKFSR